MDTTPTLNAVACDLDSNPHPAPGYSISGGFWGVKSKRKLNIGKSIRVKQTARFVELSVSECKRLLARQHPSQRSPSAAQCRRLAGEILKKRFDGMNGCTIVLSSAGSLLDGQGRLGAHVLANRPFRGLMVENVDENAFFTLDQNRRRTAAQILKCKDTAAIVRGVLRFYHGNLSPVNDDYRTYLNSAPGIDDTLQLVASTVGCKRGARFFGMLHLRLRELGVSKRRLSQFFNPLISGAALSQNDPRLHVRNWFNSEQMRGTNYAAEERAICAVERGWNLWVMKQNVTRFSVPTKRVKGRQRVNRPELHVA